MFGCAKTRRNLDIYAKALMGLFLVFTVLPSFAQHPRITQLIAEKQAKMEKLEKCQGTTKNLKIAGISTLGITAVGIGANIAEAVVLSNTKDDIEKAKAARDEQQTIKDKRLAEQKKRECEQDSTKYWTSDGYCNCKPGYVDNGFGSCALPQTAQSNSTTPTGTNAVATKNEKDGAVDAVTTEAKVENITAFKNVRLDNIDQIQRLFIVTNLITGPYGCKVESAGKGQRQDFVRCEEEEDGIVRIVEFDNIIKDNNKPGDVEKSLSQYFCGTEKPELMTISCKDNVEYVMYGGSKPKEEKSVETKTKIDSRYSEVQLNNLDQAQRLLSVYGLSSVACSSVRTGYVGAKKQDFWKCGDTEFEFDDLSDSSNDEGGTVYTSLQKHFCGNTGKSVENEPCMEGVMTVWGGTKKERKAEKKEEKPAEPQTKIDSRYSAVQLNNLDQAKRLFGADSLSSDACSSNVRTERNQDFLKCGDTEFEFDDLSDSSNGEGGRVYTSLQKYFCGNTENNLCMDKVVKVWGGTRTVKKVEAKPEPKKEEIKPEPKPIVLKSSAKEACERDGNHLWLNGKECKAIGDTCKEYYGGGEGTYKRAPDGQIRCQLSVCKTDGYKVNTSDGGYSCKNTKTGVTKDELLGFPDEIAKFERNQADAKLKKEQAEREAKEKEQEELEQRLADNATARDNRNTAIENLCVKAGCGKQNWNCEYEWKENHTKLDVKCDGKTVSQTFDINNDPDVKTLEALRINK